VFAAETTAVGLVPILLGAGGLTTIGTLILGAFQNRGSRVQSDRELQAKQWVDLLQALSRAQDDCLKREAELRRRVESLEESRWQSHSETRSSDQA